MSNYHNMILSQVPRHWTHHYIVAILKGEPESHNPDDWLFDVLPYQETECLYVRIRVLLGLFDESCHHITGLHPTQT